MNEQTAVYDGNTLAGPLSEVFAVELTTAAGRCRSCGTTSQVATIRVYGPDPGFVGRCPHCEDVLLRLVRTPDALWLDLSGVTALRIPMPIDSAVEADPDEPAEEQHHEVVYPADPQLVQRGRDAVD